MTNKLYLPIICTVVLNINASNVIQLNEVSVTATKKENLNLTQNLSISIKDEEEIKLDQITNQKELLNSLSGVRIEQTTSTIGHMTSIRMPKSTSGYYLFMQDGIPVQSSGFFNHNALAYTSFETSSNVEVLKGAGTALYGSDAVAATINVKSTNLNKKDNNTLKVKFGSNSYKSFGLETTKHLSEDESYSANINTSSSNGYREHTSYNRFESNIKYKKTINDENDIKIIFNTSKTNALQADSFSDISYINDKSKKASDNSDFYLALDKTDVKRQFDYARISLEWINYKYDDLEISISPYLRYNRNQYIATWQDNLPSNDNKINSIGLLQKNTLDTKYGEVVFGFDTEYTKSSLEYTQDFNLTVSGYNGATYTKGPIYDYNVLYKSFAPYISNIWNINSKTKLNIGARYDYNKFEYTNNLNEGTDSSGVYYRPDDKIDTFNHFSPKFSLSYMLDKTTNMYLRYANGFKIPSASRLYSMKDGYKEVSLKPETTNTYEIGYKKVLANKSYIETNIYYMNIDDTIIRKKVSGSDDYYYNGGQSIHKGIELTIYNKINTQLSSKIAYSYSKHNFKNDINYNNNEMKEAPKHTANLRLFYVPTKLKQLKTMLEMQYVSSYWMDNDNTKEYEGYKIFNIKSSYKLNNDFIIFSKINNIYNKAYASSASSGWGDSYTPGSLREYYFGMEYKF